MNEITGQVRPISLVDASRKACQLGRFDDAEATLRACIERYPQFPLAVTVLADLLASLGRTEEATELWYSAIRHFPQVAKKQWFLRLAAALRQLDRLGEEEIALTDVAGRFPGSVDILAKRAELAMRKEAWIDAFALWEQCVGSKIPKREPRWLNGRATTLLRILRPEDAIAAWEQIIEEFPNYAPAYVARACAEQELGLWATGARHWAELRDRFPDRDRPEWIANQARCLVQLNDPAAESVIADLEARFPDSPLGRRILMERANILNFSIEVRVALVEEAIRRFPMDRVLLVHFVRLLLAQGRRTEACVIAEAMAASANDNFALISRLRIIRDHAGDDAIKIEVHSTVAASRWTLPETLSIAGFLLEIRTNWAAELALFMLDDVANRFPGRPSVVAAKAKALITMLRDDQALLLIDSLPAIYQTQPILELKAWAAACRGDVDFSRQFWRTILSTYYFPAIHAAEPTLELVMRQRRASQTGDITLFAAIRDESQNIAEFLAHHRRIGINHFIIIDNMSTDGVDGYLCDQSDVTLYRTRDKYGPAKGGIRWINALIQRHGAGGWCVHADADEALIYPGWETTPIQHLIAYLDSVGAEGMAAFMLDVYPERLISADGRTATRNDCVYYDDDYRWAGEVCSPYRCPLGGARSRLFGFQHYLPKVPLIKSSRGVHIGVHQTTPLRLAQVSGLLLHYMMLTLTKRPSLVCNRGFEGTHRYTRYASRAAALRDTDLRAPGVSKLLTDSRNLTDRGLMCAPPAFKPWTG